ncbi:MAG TPA: NUDIX domain-containing protein [Acidimicrobiales bacterium]|nr:NUDIX domain-containing protein [Acidimicrobiales bacterium]
MPVASSGLLLYRVRRGVLQVLIGHMGGPFWAGKQAAAWSIPKGEDDGGDPLATARREFEEELGQPVPTDDLEDLGTFRQSAGKVVRVFAGAGDLDASACRSNTVEVQWPPRSGRTIEVPEIDRAEWVDAADARDLLVRGQVAALEELLERVRSRHPGVSEGGAPALGGSS